MRIVGLDMSTAISGVADDSGTFGIKTPNGMKGAERLEFLRKMIRAVVIGNDQPKANLVVIEGYFVGRTSMSAVIPLAELGGVIRTTLHRAEVPYVDVAPTRLKEFATGKGGSGKGDMILAAFKRGRIEFTEKQNDECDAWWLRQMGLHAYNLEGAVKLPQVQTDVLKAIDWPVLLPSLEIL